MPFFPRWEKGYARIFTRRSCQFMQVYTFSPKMWTGGTPFYLHASLTNWCRHTPCFLKKEIEVCPFIYMQLLKHMQAYWVPLFPRIGKTDTPICLHANLPNLRNHMFPAVHVFLSHAGLANGCRHTPLFPKREKGIDLDISLAILADRCQHTYFSRK